MLLGRAVPKNSSTYTITADLTNFAADKMMMGQKVEAPALRVSASSDGYQINGDVKINGTPATIDLSKKKGDAQADLHLQAMVDEAARRRLGIDFGGAVTGAIPVKLATRVGGDDKDSPMTVDADLTPVKIDNLLPGWVKPAGKPAHATYTLAKTGQTARFDDLTIAGPGVECEGLGRTRRRERDRIGEFSGVRPVGWRQGHAQGRPRQRRRAARGDARRRL